MDESRIFSAALERPVGAEREAFLEEACAGDGELHARVARLLDAHANPDSFLSSPPHLVPPSDDVPETLDGVGGERPGSSVGPYKLLQQIGEGGMGVVFMAEQEKPVKRRVAVKIIKPGMDTREVIARFEAERQALAMMDHPNIAKVLDAGATSQGRPYFVMELVHGLPITQYCDEHNLSTRRRLELFAAVGRAVQHAHQKGVIHRDLKPGNILVAEYDHLPVPKVIDFGVAKATNRQLTDKTLFTQFGQIVGTLEYMSPEQAKRNQLDVDTRSDVYSLGIVLYELLTGETPFDKKQLRSAALEEMLRIIREEEPPRPSVKLSSSAALPVVAAKRSVEPAKLASLIRGDLDWIVLKALQKDRSKRYATAQELTTDVTRHLENQPIAAGPPRLLTRLRKFTRRNRSKVQMTALMFGLLIGLLAWLAVWQNQRFQAARAAEQAQQRRSSAVVQAIETAALALGEAAASPVGKSASWRAAEVSRQQVLNLVAEGAVDPEVKQQAESFLDRYDNARQEREIADRLENVLITSASHPDLESWTRMEQELRQLFLDHGFDLQNEKPLEIARRIREHPFADRFSDALELWIGTRGHLSAIGGPAATRANMQPWADAMYAADDDPLRTGIRRLIYAGTPPSAEQVDALTDGIDFSSVSPRTLSWLGSTYLMARQSDKADRIYRLALRHHASDLMLNFDYGYTLAAQQRWQEAIRMYSRCLALRPDAAGVWHNMGLAMQRVDELDNAREALRLAVEYEADYGPTWVHLGNVLLKQKRAEEALAAGRRAVELMPKKPAGYGIAGRALLLQQKFEAALVELRRCHDLGAEDPRWKEPSEQWIQDCLRQMNVDEEGEDEEGVDEDAEDAEDMDKE